MWGAGVSRIKVSGMMDLAAHVFLFNKVCCAFVGG